jgi:UPF0755 protein
MAMYRGSGPPGGNGRGQSRANGAYPPMPSGPYHGPAMPPGMPPSRFTPPSDPYYRGGPIQGRHNSQYPSDLPPFARNGSGPYPPYGPYRPPIAPPPTGPGRWSPPVGPVNGGHMNGGHMNGGHTNGSRMNGSQMNGHGQHLGGPPGAPPVRRYSESYPPNGYIPGGYGPNNYAPKGRTESRPYGPPGALPNAARGTEDAPYGPQPRANIHYAPAAPSRYGQDAANDRPSPRPNLPPAGRLGNAAGANGHEAPANGRRSFTPVQDYLAGTDIVADHPRASAPKTPAYNHDSRLQESHLQASHLQNPHLNGHVMPANPLPLGEDYSARALAELAQAMENATQHSVDDLDVRMSEAGVALLERDGSFGDEGQSWDGDTITPESLENLLGRSDLDEPLVADDTLMEKKPINPRSPRAALEPERVPQPTRRSTRARHPLVVAGNAVFTLLIILAVVAGGALLVGKQRFEAAGPLDSDKIVTIPKGLGIRDISELLVQEGVIEQPWIFMGGVFVLKARDELKAGEYQFTKHASLRDVIGTIVDGKVIQHQLTLAEGLTSEQIVERILENDLLTGNIREVPREGTLLPETYKLVRGTSREQLIQRMQQAQRRAVQEIWDHRAPDLPLKSPEQLVTLASIVEKETGRPEERSRVAAVFVNRLKQRMRLQSDPTIIYGLVGGKGSLGRPIMRSEIEQPTPYNTYVIDGLPPGPIANPGRASLEATANPARTKEVFFVADGTGGHAFAESLDQHQKNVARLRAIEQQQRDAPWPTAPAPAAGAPDSGAAAPPGPGPAKPRPRSAATKPTTTQ